MTQDTVNRIYPTLFSEWRAAVRDLDAAELSGADTSELQHGPAAVLAKAEQFDLPRPTDAILAIAGAIYHASEIDSEDPHLLSTQRLLRSAFNGLIEWSGISLEESRLNFYVVDAA